MSYYDNVYKNRVNFYGSTRKDRMRGRMEVFFDHYLEIAAEREEMVVERNQVPFICGVLTERDNPSRMLKKILVKKDTPIIIGDLVLWDRLPSPVGEYNYWIVWQKEQPSFDYYDTYHIVRCNYLLTWIDDWGVRNSQYIFQFSSLESMVRDSFKIRSKNLIVAEPNKFLEIIMPYTNRILREDRFIIEGEPWNVVEMDQTSVNNILYITMGEDRKNAPAEDLLISRGDPEDLADYKKEGKFKMQVDVASPLYLNIGESRTITPTLLEYGSAALYDRYRYKIDNQYVEDTSGNILVAPSIDIEYSDPQTIILRIETLDRPEIFSEIQIEVSTSKPMVEENSIVGDDYIPCGRSRIYQAKHFIDGTEDPTATVVFNLQLTDLASIEIISQNQCKINTNMRNNLGNIILEATINGVLIQKPIQIRSIW